MTIGSSLTSLGDEVAGGGGNCLPFSPSATTPEGRAETNFTQPCGGVDILLNDTMGELLLVTSKVVVGCLKLCSTLQSCSGESCDTS